MAIKLDVYLKFNGTCKETFEFYSKVFHIPLTYSTTYGEQEETSFVKKEDKHKILHCGLNMTKEAMLWGCDIVEGGDDPRWGDPRFVEGTNVIMSINPDTEKEAKRIFAELSAGGQVTIPLEKSFWNALFGMLTDKFDILWMVNYSYEQE